jgi:hypothetical protein
MVSLAWDGKMWVGVGNASTNNTLGYSTNGTTWTGLGTTSISVGTVIKWNGQMWVAGLYPGGTSGAHTLSYSTNGTIWIGLGKAIFSTDCNGLIWNGQMWVAGGQGTNTIAYSIGGTIWTGLGLNIFSNICRCIESNYNARPNTITFPERSTEGLVAGTASQSSDITLSSGQAIEIVTDSYYQEGTTKICINIQA